MIRKIDIRIAAKIVLIMSFCAMLFHLSVLSGVVPFNVIWGGRLQDTKQMYLFESLSIVITIAIVFVVCVKVGYVKRAYLPRNAVTVMLWGLVILFVLNTVGNLFSKTTLETILFTPLTLINAVLFYRMAIEDD